MSKKLSSILCMSIIFTLLLSGCGGGGSKSSTGSGPGTGVTLGSITGYLFVPNPGNMATMEVYGTSSAPAGMSPAPGAQITLNGTTFTTKTDSNAQFTINSIPAGTYTVAATTSGGQTGLFTVTVQNYTTTGILTPVQATIKGYVYSNGTSIAVSGSSTPPGGYSALSGARVQWVTGNSYIGPSSGSNGYFNINITPFQAGGPYHIRVTSGSLIKDFSAMVPAGDNPCTFTDY